MSDNDSNAAASDAPAARDASLKVDASALHGDELDFAQMMGFGDDPEEAAEEASKEAPKEAPEPEAKAAPEPAPEAEAESEPEPEPQPEPEPEKEAEVEAAAEPAPEDEPEAEESPAAEAEAEAETESEAPSPSEEIEAEEEPEGVEPVRETPAASEPPLAAEAGSESTGDQTDWEEIHPRPSADGNQTLLQERARDVLAQSERVSLEATPGRGAAASAPARPDVSEPERPVEPLAPDEAIAAAADPGLLAELEKERDGVASELETLTTEHDLLLDHVAGLQGQLVRSNEEAERLQVSLRTARAALTPLPEGERALRAEVMGLRERLEVAHRENQALSLQHESSATELAITQARFEDRQHEVNVRLDEIEQLGRELSEAKQAVVQSAEKQREHLELSTRLQAENNEFRSAQAALEETLEARSLEINAREEHLAVTREGLLARDRQIIDLNAILEETRNEVDRAETELARRDVEGEQHRRALERREKRIASLSETLAKIEKVMGRRVEPLLIRQPLTTVSGERAELTSPASSEPQMSETPLPLASYDDVLGEHSETALSDHVEFDVDADVQAAPSNTAGGERPLLAPWRNGCLSEWMSPMGAETLPDYFAAHLASQFDTGWPATLRIMSLAGDQLDAEIRLLEALQNRGVSSVELTILDENSERAARRQARAHDAGWGDQVEIRAELPSLSSANSEVQANGAADAVLLCDALFGRGEAAQTLEWATAVLSDQGLLFFADQIRGGALSLSPDTLSRLEEIWTVLPEAITELPGFASLPMMGDDGGVAEAVGTPIESLLASLISRADVGLGHLADLVVGPARGVSLSDEDPATKRLLYSIFGLDESRSITESLPPRHGVGVFAKPAAGEAVSSAAPLFSAEWDTRDEVSEE
ncbi:MAG: hypothetical protein AB8G23_16700 [Myxococcota bacterium]